MPTGLGRQLRGAYVLDGRPGKIILEWEKAAICT